MSSFSPIFLSTKTFINLKAHIFLRDLNMTIPIIKVGDRQFSHIYYAIKQLADCRKLKVESHCGITLKEVKEEYQLGSGSEFFDQNNNKLYSYIMWNSRSSNFGYEDITDYMLMVTFRKRRLGFTGFSR